MSEQETLREEERKTGVEADGAADTVKQETAAAGGEAAAAEETVSRAEYEKIKGERSICRPSGAPAGGV
jgi:hypothetical protein